jgi:hypothetical protein
MAPQVALGGAWRGIISVPGHLTEPTQASLRSDVSAQDPAAEGCKSGAPSAPADGIHAVSDAAIAPPAAAAVAAAAASKRPSVGGGCVRVLTTGGDLAGVEEGTDGPSPATMASAALGQSEEATAWGLAAQNVQVGRKRLQLRRRRF